MWIADELDVGMVHVNDQAVNGGPFAPVGGPRKSGNGTRIGGPADIEESTTWKWVSVKDAATPIPSDHSQDRDASVVARIPCVCQFMSEIAMQIKAAIARAQGANLSLETLDMG
ncbi:hypothetical protein ACVINI_005881 [Rhizobium beringeri]|nr:aldehyde dehydrogenase family protein [Rhizobium leguminosarum]